MDTTDDENYTSATKLSRRRRGPGSTALEYSAATGRRPAFDAGGNIRGFRSRAGAPNASMSPTGIGDFGTGMTPAPAWDQFFKSNRTPLSLAPEMPVNAPAMATLGSATAAPVTPVMAPPAAPDMQPQTGNYQPFSPFTAQQPSKPMNGTLRSQWDNGMTGSVNYKTPGRYGPPLPASSLLSPDSMMLPDLSFQNPDPLNQVPPSPLPSVQMNPTQQQPFSVKPTVSLGPSRNETWDDLQRRQGEIAIDRKEHTQNVVNTPMSYYFNPFAKNKSGDWAEQRKRIRYKEDALNQDFDKFFKR